MPSLEKLTASLDEISRGAIERGAAREIRRTYQCDASEVPAYGKRFLRMIRSFHARYHDLSEARLFRAPGRVNLIGEHTDYNGYPVLPMAIDRDIAALVTPSSGPAIELMNTDPAYAPRTFSLEKSIAPFGQGDWGNYVKASMQGLITEGLLPETARGFRAVLDGTIPDSAGLSSSAALVVVSALAALAVNGVVVEPLHLAEVLARAERYVGTEGGGMDQAISLLGRSGTALKIDFFPLAVDPVPFPGEYAIVVTNSLVRAAKSAGARDHYNRRVVECRCAAALGAHAASKRLRRRLTTVLLSDLAPEKIGIPEQEIDALVRQEAGTSPLTMCALAGILGVPTDMLRESTSRLRNGSLFAEPPEGLKVWKRYRHVVSEARRVEKAREALRGGAISEFGQLMYQSHESCRDDYEVSCPELETLVSLARKYKAVGSRLTGAGFGGCTVSLVRKEEASDFARELWQQYSASLPAAARADIRDAVFISQPAQGAGELFSSI